MRMIKLTVTQTMAIQDLNVLQHYPTVVVVPIEYNGNKYIGESIITAYPEYGVVIGEYEVVDITITEVI